MTRIRNESPWRGTSVDREERPHRDTRNDPRGGVSGVAAVPALGRVGSDM